MTEPLDPEPIIEQTDTPEAPKGGREARYRVERNEAREQLAAANERIARWQRAEIERIAGETLAMPGDLWINGNDVTDYLTEDGYVDPDKVSADVELMLSERPGLQKPVPAPAAVDRSQGLGTFAETRPTSFTGLFSD